MCEIKGEKYLVFPPVDFIAFHLLCRTPVDMLIVYYFRVMLFVMSRYQFPIVIEWDEESKLYIGHAPGIHGAHTQAATLDELDANMREVIELCLEESRTWDDDRPRFVGVHQIEIER